jgi:hypothetical protein
LASTLVIEGEAGSLDYRLLHRLLVDCARVDGLTLRPAGGDATVRAVVAHLRGHEGGTVLGLVDRNRGGGESTDHVVVLARHEIENYLLEPGVVLAACEVLRTAPSAGCTPALPADEAAVLDLLGELAAPLVPLHCLRQVEALLRARIGAALGDLGRTSYSAPRPNDGSAAACLASLEQEARRFVAACAAAAELADLAPAAVRALWTPEHARLTASEFLASGQFLVELDGKQLLAALVAKLQATGRPRASFAADFERLLIDGCAERWAAAPTFFVELRDLAERLRR